jgi:peptide/nickel transport system substrate-binding protein
MNRLLLHCLASLVFIQFFVGIPSSLPSLAQEWAIQKARGTITVVDLYQPTVSVMFNYAEGLVNLDKDNNWVPCLASNWRWVDDHTVEFKLRKGVRFHNGEEFDAETLRINWQEYRKMENPRAISFTNLPDETIFEIIDQFTVRFTLPEPDGLAFVKFLMFCQAAPAFFEKHKVPEKNWLYFPEPGPWGTGPFKLAEGGVPFAKPTDRIVLEAYEDYWDPRYPRVNKVIFDNTLIGNRKEAMRLCRESEGAVDIVSHIRPLDTLKIAESPFAKVVKSKDVVCLRGLFNERKKDTKWTDIRLRKALNYAINREELWKYAAKGNAYNLGGYIPPWGYGHNPNLTLYPYDTDRARALLAEAGYPNGFEVLIIAPEAWRLETQIIAKMLERIGLKVRFEVLSFPEFFRKIFMPILDKPPEDQEWDIALGLVMDLYGHTAASFLTFGFTEESDTRWMEYDPVYEKKWKDMVRTTNSDAQEKKVQELVHYLYDGAQSLFIYTPLALYAVNKEVDFVPQKMRNLRFKETSLTDNHWSLREEN